MISFYDNQQIDYRCAEFFNYSQYIWPLVTTEDGNCLFNAISNSIYGNEMQSHNLKLCSAFIVFENQSFFQKVLEADGNTTTVSSLIAKMLKYGKLQDRITIVA